MIIQYFVPHESSEWVFEFLLDWIYIIGIFALALGIWSLIRVSWEKIRYRKENWQYAVVTLLGLFFMIFFGFDYFRNFFNAAGLQNFMFRHFFDYIMIPIQATMFSLLAFFFVFSHLLLAKYIKCILFLKCMVFSFSIETSKLAIALFVN